MPAPPSWDPLGILRGVEDKSRVPSAVERINSAISIPPFKMRNPLPGRGDAQMQHKLLLGFAPECFKLQFATYTFIRLAQQVFPEGKTGDGKRGKTAAATGSHLVRLFTPKGEAIILSLKSTTKWQLLSVARKINFAGHFCK